MSKCKMSVLLDMTLNCSGVRPVNRKVLLYTRSLDQAFEVFFFCRSINNTNSTNIQNIIQIFKSLQILQIKDLHETKELKSNNNNFLEKRFKIYCSFLYPKNKSLKYLRFEIFKLFYNKFSNNYPYLHSLCFFL